MIEQQKQMKRYMTAIERRLNLPLEVKARVMNDLQSSVAARREAGQTDEEIFADMGTPEAVAAELNEQMKEYAYTKSKWRWAALAAAVLGGLMLLFEGLTSFLAQYLYLTPGEQASLGIIGGADGPTVISVAVVSGNSNWLLWVLVTAMGLLGWWKLGHCKGKGI